MSEKVTPLGYDAYDQPVVLMEFESHVPLEQVAQLEVGHHRIRLQRVDPGLVSALKASLKRGA